MKLWKKIALFSLILATFFSFCLPAFADVIVEPSDLFYNTHKDECDHRDFRQYTVNTEDGYAYIYVSPGSSQTVKGISNGEVVGFQWFYTDKDGEEWGVRTGESGWFRMSDLTLIYDALSFLEEYADEIRDYEEGSYFLEATEENPVERWKYPGVKYESSPMTNGDVSSCVQKIYTDEQGVVWGYIPYRSGRRNFWVCLSEGEKVENPVSSDPATETPSGLKAEPVPTDQIPMSEGNRRTMILVGSLVGGVVAVTGGVIAVLLITKKKKEN